MREDNRLVSFDTQSNVVIYEKGRIVLIMKVMVVL